MTSTRTQEEHSPPGLLVGPGRRAEEVGGVLEVLVTTRAPGPARTAEGERAPRARFLDDLDELLLSDLRARPGTGRSGDGEPTGDDIGGRAGERHGSSGTPGRAPDHGTLVLEAEEVPREDIGFVRRFLERRRGWRLAVLAADPTGADARALLALPHARWIPWPPNLDQLAALLGSADAPAAAPAGDRPPDAPADGPPRGPDSFAAAPVTGGAAASPTAPAAPATQSQLLRPHGTRPTAPAAETDAAAATDPVRVAAATGPTCADDRGTEHAAAASGPQGGSDADADHRPDADRDEPQPAPREEPAPAPRGPTTDLGRLVEELLAGQALSGTSSPRYLYRCDGLFPVRGERDRLAASLEGFLTLARRATGPGGVVSVVVGPLADADAVLLRIDFPPGDLGDTGIEELLRRAEASTEDASDEFGHALAGAARSAARLRQLGAEPTLNSLEDGRLRLGVEFPAADPGAPAPPSGEHRVGAETARDPFA